jgi:transcription elongation factor GreB
MTKNDNPPVPPELKNPMTPAGYTRIVAEFEQLRDVERPKVVAGVATAAAEGDRSENAEYIYGKKRLREIDKRLYYLSGLLKDVQIVDPQHLKGDRVCFACTVTIKEEEGKQRRYQIVGVGESDVGLGSISWRSPLAKGLMGKKVGDFVEIEKPSGLETFEVVKIEFV